MGYGDLGESPFAPGLKVRVRMASVSAQSFGTRPELPAESPAFFFSSPRSPVGCLGPLAQPCSVGWTSFAKRVILNLFLWSGSGFLKVWLDSVFRKSAGALGSRWLFPLKL